MELIFIERLTVTWHSVGLFVEVNDAGFSQQNLGGQYSLSQCADGQMSSDKALWPPFYCRDAFPYSLRGKRNF